MRPKSYTWCLMWIWNTKEPTGVMYNDRDSQDSKKAEIIIGRTDEAVECTEDELNNLGHPDNKEQTTDQPLAKDKVALLIGNMNYREHPSSKLLWWTYTN